MNYTSTLSQKVEISVSRAVFDPFTERDVIVVCRNDITQQLSFAIPVTTSLQCVAVFVTNCHLPVL